MVTFDLEKTSVFAFIVFVMNLISVWLGLALASFIVALPHSCGVAASVPEVDIRRDAAVEAVQRVMPSVVNVATEELMPVRDPLENLFREFFDPYHRHQQPNTQYSLGSGVIIDEEGFV